MDLTSIKAIAPPSKQKNKKAKRRGRGTGSGLGKTSGRGHKGAGQRKGKKLPYIGFAGGNLPFLRQIPKRGFNSPNPKIYQIVNLTDIQKKLDKDTELTPDLMSELGLIKDKNKPIKILAKTEDALKLKLKIKADKFSKKAKELIESAGGVCECLKQ